MNYKQATWIASCGGAGFIPFAPGTWGSLVGLILSLILNLGWISLIFIFCLGLYCSKIITDSAYGEVSPFKGHPARGFPPRGLLKRTVDDSSAPICNKKFDPQFIVIDEFAGILLALLIFKTWGKSIHLWGNAGSSFWHDVWINFYHIFSNDISNDASHDAWQNMKIIFLLLGLFRLFDILKPLPISWIDKKLCKTRKWAPLGIMLDDILAGVVAGISAVWILC